MMNFSLENDKFNSVSYQIKEQPSQGQRLTKGSKNLLINKLKSIKSGFEDQTGGKCSHFSIKDFGTRKLKNLNIDIKVVMQP